MGITGTPHGDHKTASSQGKADRGAGEPGEAAGEPGEAAGEPGEPEAGEVSQVLADLYHAQYRSLLRLAALLTGDAYCAETVVRDAFVALHRLRKRLRPREDALPQLRRLLVARSRVSRHHHPRVDGTPAATAGTPGLTGSRQAAPELQYSPLTQALRGLPAGQREAIVLTLYLNLTDEQAAAAMRVSQATLRRRLAEARSALRAALAGHP
jgi:DNA-directed RNA polymerase specialized sigma24 family protein